MRLSPLTSKSDLVRAGHYRAAALQYVKHYFGGVMQLIFRFAAGGLIVSLFAVAGDILKPKSFAGLFGAAPSVALATLGLTIFADGKAYAALEARSMIAGAIAFLLYAGACARVMAKHEVRAGLATIAALALWLGCAVGSWLIFLR